MTSVNTPVRIHLTNVSGAGASQLLLSLLPALENDKFVHIERIDLPERGLLTSYSSSNHTTVTRVYRRCLPNALSRVLECTLLASRFDGDSPLLVLGDLPLQCRGVQTLFVQNAHLLKPSTLRFRLGSLKYVLARLLFRVGMDRVSAFIVQTQLMRDGLLRSYPSIAGRVHVVAQPVPEWLLRSGLNRKAVERSPGTGLRLIYPAASYTHKNHSLLANIDPLAVWPVERLSLTLCCDAHPAPRLAWVECCGFLSPRAMIKAYSQVDALLFLSKEESYGFPLLEAMYVGLPIVCPNLPYAHTLCGDQAIYFDPDQPEELRLALVTLQTRLDQGWWPDWKDQLSGIPEDWDDVAQRMLAITCNRVVIK